MSQINIKGTVGNIKERTTVYTPLMEAVVNAIDAIDASGRKDGKVEIIIKRTNDQDLPFDGSALPDVSDFEVRDNGIGFTKENRNSFDTLYSEFKNKSGGKGFGRFMFMKYFEDVSVESIYKEAGSYHSRTFDFGKKDTIVVNEKISPSKTKETGTVVFLKHLKEQKFEKQVDTIAKKLLEKLLIYYVDESYTCPQIVLKDVYTNKEVNLSSYLKTHSEIQEISSMPFILRASDGKDESFQVKVFKIYFPDTQKSKISLVAHKREVTETFIQHYIPEFSENFYDEDKKGIKRDFMLKTYVLGKYLNENVSLERVSFNFSKKDAEPLYPFSQEAIEREAAHKTKDAFPEEIVSRQKKKKERILEYVAEAAPWHRSYLSNLDLTAVPYDIDSNALEIELQRAKFKKEQSAKKQIEQVLNSKKDDIPAKIEGLLKEITEIGKSDLVHYVCNRKVVLDFLHMLLERDDDGSAKYEKEIHNVIFPMGKSSHDIEYEDHNLWILDERLVFSHYIASDKKISKKASKTEPDLVVFDNRRSFRNGDNEFSNPLTIFEFKRPKRTTYKQEDDPILQIGNYVKEIRAGKYEMPKGLEKIKVNDCTPVCGYIVCDIEEKIKSFATQHQLTLSPDGEGYFGFHNGYKMYVEIISYKKLLKDAELRNKIFFHKLNLQKSAKTPTGLPA